MHTITRLYCGVEATESSTNKHHTLSHPVRPLLFRGAAAPDPADA